MASPDSADSADSPFGLTQISSSVTSENSLAFFRTYGLFYQEDGNIGNRVKELFDSGGTINVKLEDFRPALTADARLRSILEHYPDDGEFRFYWGKVTKYYYNWDFLSRDAAQPNIPSMDTAQPNVLSIDAAQANIVVYLLYPTSKCKCYVKSHRTHYKPNVAAIDGTLRVSDEELKGYQEISINMPKGGVLIVHPVLVHRTEDGRSIIRTGCLKGWKPQHLLQIRRT